MSAYFTLAVLCAIPSFIRLYRATLPCKVSDDCKRFIGSPSKGWVIQTFTGYVTNSSVAESVHVSGSSSNVSYSGTGWGSGRITSQKVVTDRFYLISPWDRSEQRFELTAMHVNPRDGHLVSVAWAVNGSETRNMFAYNHNTREVSSSQSGMNNIQIRHFKTMAFNVGLNFWNAVNYVTLIIWFILTLRQKARFASSGVEPLMKKFYGECASLQAQAQVATQTPLPPPPAEGQTPL